MSNAADDSPPPPRGRVKMLELMFSHSPQGALLMSHSRVRLIPLIALSGLLGACGSPPSQRPEGTAPTTPAKDSTFEKTEQSFGSGGERKLLGTVPAMDETGIPWGGTINLQRPSDPANLNPITRRDYESTQICRLLYPQLAKVHA